MPGLWPSTFILPILQNDPTTKLLAVLWNLDASELALWPFRNPLGFRSQVEPIVSPVTIRAVRETYISNILPHCAAGAGPDLTYNDCDTSLESILRRECPH